MRASPSAQDEAGAVNPSPGVASVSSDPLHVADASVNCASAHVTSRTTREAALEFWRRVARGTVRLSPETDALITTLRKAGLGWVEVTERIRAAHVREQRGAIQARYRDRQRGKRWREEYRQAKGDSR